MSETSPPAVSDDDLHAYVDGRLDAARRVEIELVLAEDPQLAAEIANWKAQNEGIRAQFAQLSPRPDERRLIEELSRARRRSWRPRQLSVGAAVALMAFGVVAGVAGTLALLPAAREDGMQLLPQAARTNYLIYTREARHAVEVGADEEAHLVTWLGRRLGSEIAAPDLTGEGFRLMGGRLVPYRNRPGALLMYENDQGQRLTLFFGRSDTNRETGFRFDVAEAVQTFYWIDGAVGYAISGEIDRAQLERVSRLAYRHLPTL